MKSAILLATLMLSGLSAQADIFKCTFTEPFVDVTYTTGTQVLKVQNYSEPSSKVFSNIGFLVTGVGQFQLVDKSGKVVMNLALTGQGSDGMSSTSYPYEVSYPGLPGNNIGGCSSLKLKSTPGSN